MTRPRDCARTSAPAPRGFSLVELLLAVFILAIGIISVAAIFPAGIVQQVQTKDAIYGPIVAEQAIGMLRSKLSPDDFGTFEQFGLTEADRYRNASGTGFDEEIQGDALGTVPGDWGWMRPSFILADGQPPLAPGLTPAEVTQPEALDGAIDIFSLRHTRERAFNEDFDGGGLPELDGELDPNKSFFTSEFGKSSTANFYGELEGVIRSTDPNVLPFRQYGVNGEATILGGIPFNRARYAIFDPPTPYYGSDVPDTIDYRLDPGRAGRLEPLVTFTQGERAWPIGSATPEYYWECMFRRYQGRIQVAIFVYRVAFGGSGPRPYTVNGCAGQDADQWPSESPLPARVDFPFRYQTESNINIEIPRWYPEGADSNDPTDDMRIPNTLPANGDVAYGVPLDPYDNGWQSPGQWLLDQNGNVHQVFAGRRNPAEGPVRLAQRIPYIPRQSTNGNLFDESGAETDVNTASAVKSIWFIPPESRDGITLIPVFVAVKDL